MEPRRLPWWVLVLELVAIGAISAGAIALYRNPTVHVDETFHLMGARAVNAGQPLEYPRARLFTYAVAWATRLGGESLTVARLPASASVVLLVVALFAWVRHEAGRIAAWTAALLLAVNIFTLDLAQFCRFYGPHGLAVFGMWIGTYYAVKPGVAMPRRVAWAVLSAAAAGLGLHLQATTAVAGAGLVTWLGLLALWTVGTSTKLTPRVKYISIGAAAAIVIVAAVGVYVTGLWARAMHLFQWAPSWLDPAAMDRLYYHRDLLKWDRTLWLLTPVAMAVAAIRRPRVASFAIVLFGVGMVIMSLSAIKAWRYVFFLMPMWFTIWGIAISTAVWLAYLATTSVLSPRVKRPSSKLGLGIACSAAVAIVAALGIYYTNNVYSNTLHRLRKPGTNAFAPWGDYDAAIAAVKQSHRDALDAPFVLASPASKARYYFPNAQVMLLGKSERSTEGNYANDEATLKREMAAHPRGLIVIDEGGGCWRDDRFVDNALADTLERLTQTLPVPAEAKVRMFYWDRSTSATTNAP